VTEVPTPVDPEVAAVTFSSHLLDFFAHGRPTREAGWATFSLDPLHAIVIVPACRQDGGVDPYFVRLGATCYDLWPPSAAFVEPVAPGGWQESPASSLWWPRINGAPFSFGLHNPYQYPDGQQRQLLCFSHTLDYYLSNHSPTSEERWRAGTHTLSATLNRLAEVLRPPYYQSRSGGNNS
jgi:hypothetical protein